MNVRKTDDFIADIERQFEWYAVNAGWEVADRYLVAVEATCRLLGQRATSPVHARPTPPAARLTRVEFRGDPPLIRQMGDWGLRAVELDWPFGYVASGG